MAEIDDDQFGKSGTISVEVTDYSLNGDTNFYNSHNFILQVWMGQQMYTLIRSYSAFCELDSRFRRQYMRSNLPTLPLAGQTAFSKKVVKSSLKSQTKDTRGSIIDSRASILVPGVPEKQADKRTLIKRIDNNEVISNKKGLLHCYMQDLLRIPEILLSDILLNFLDEESLNGEPIIEELDSEVKDNLELTLLLDKSETVAKTVRRDYTVDLTVDPQSVVIYSFNTKYHDIAFNIRFNEIEVLTYQRYNTSEKTVRGAFEVQQHGKLTLWWDNNYSKMRNKFLNYTVKIINQEDYSLALSMAADIKRDKAKFSKQRTMLRKALQKTSANILAEYNATSYNFFTPQTTSSSSYTKTTRRSNDLNSDRSSNTSRQSLEGLSPAVTAFQRINNNNAAYDNTEVDIDTEPAVLHEMIIKLQNEKRQLQQTLSESEKSLVEERTQTAKYIQLTDTNIQKISNLESEAAYMRSEMDYFRNLENEREEIASRERQLKEYSIDELMIVPSDEIHASQIVYCFEQLRAYAAELTLKLSQSDEKNRTNEASLAKLRAERKQLKSYAIQLKEDSEKTAKALTQCESEKTLALYENDVLKQRVESIGLELHAAQETANNRITAATTPTSPVPILSTTSSTSSIGNVNNDTPSVLTIKATKSTVHTFNDDDEEEVCTVDKSMYISTNNNSYRDNGSNNNNTMDMVGRPLMRTATSLFQSIQSTFQDDIDYIDDDDENVVNYPKSVDHQTTKNNMNNDDDEDDDALMRYKQQQQQNKHQSSNASRTTTAGQNLITIDLASPPPDELQTYMHSVKSSIYEMMPVWTDLTMSALGVSSNNNSNSNNSRGGGGSGDGSRLVSDDSIRSGNSSGVYRQPPPKKQMSFGF